METSNLPVEGVSSLPHEEEVKMHISQKQKGESRAAPWRRVCNVVCLLLVIAGAAGIGYIIGRQLASAGDPFLHTSASLEATVLQASRANGLTHSIIPRSYQARAISFLSVMYNDDLEMHSSPKDEELIITTYALLCLFFATNSVRTPTTDRFYGYGTWPKWQGAWTNDGSDVCLWEGVVCDDNNKVTRITVAQRGLTGYLPLELALLRDSLTALDVSYNPGLGEGGFPSEVFFPLTQLRTLAVDHCSFVNTTVAPALCQNLESITVDCGMNVQCTGECCQCG